MTWPKKVRDLIVERSRGVCEGCGAAPVSEIHHRQYKSRGGKDTVSNGLALCGAPGGLPGGNAAGCHGMAHTRAGEELGWSVRSGFNPRNVAVVYRGGAVWLTDDGRAVPVGETEF